MFSHSRQGARQAAGRSEGAGSVLRGEMNRGPVTNGAM